MKNEVDASKKSIMLACIAGERHEIGLLSLGIKFRAKGHTVLYLGSDMPSSEVADAAIFRNVSGIGLSVVNPVELSVVLHYLEKLRGMVSPSVKIFLGGNGTKEWKQPSFDPFNVQLGGSVEQITEALG
jgi:methanogenic corrinoid protein MtbC1